MKKNPEYKTLGFSNSTDTILQRLEINQNQQFSHTYFILPESYTL